MARLERDLMTQIKNRLGVYKCSGECIWFFRIPSGKAKVGTYYINLAEAGTPDYVALIRNREDNITVLFLEAKSDTGKLSSKQSDFMNKYNRKPGICVLEIRDINTLDVWIEKNAKDFVATISI